MEQENNDRKHIFSGAPWESRVGYCRAVRAGDTIYLSGTTAVDNEGRVKGEDDPYQQARHALEIMRSALEEAGSGLEDVVRTRIYVTDIDSWEAVGKAHAEYFSEIRPATTMVEVPRLIDPGMLVEIEAVAVIGGGSLSS
ncbi:MAG: RidA family protein [Balneolaceae bacterium]|nr:RidA family protein [Balneolaceae bacterium]